MKSTITSYYLGITICKAKLDVHSTHWKASRCFPNTPEGLRDLWVAIGEIPGQVHIVCDPTGGYEPARLAEASRREAPISAVNPRQVRDYARAKEQLAKTDSIDAAILTEYGEVFSPRPLQALHLDPFNSGPPPCHPKRCLRSFLTAEPHSKSSMLRQVFAKAYAYPAGNISTLRDPLAVDRKRAGRARWGRERP